jgi:hypothetical protein
MILMRNLILKLDNSFVKTRKLTISPFSISFHPNVHSLYGARNCCTSGKATAECIVVFLSEVELCLCDSSGLARAQQLWRIRFPVTMGR